MLPINASAGILSFLKASLVMNDEAKMLPGLIRKSLNHAGGNEDQAGDRPEGVWTRRRQNSKYTTAIII